MRKDNKACVDILDFVVLVMYTRVYLRPSCVQIHLYKDNIIQLEGQKSKMQPQSPYLIRILNLITVFWKSKVTVTELDEISHIWSPVRYSYIFVRLT